MPEREHIERTAASALTCLERRHTPQGEGIVHGEVLERISTPIFLFTLEAAGQRLVYVNRAFERWAGYSAATLLGSDWRAACRIAADDPGLIQLQSSVTDGRGARAVVRARTFAGSRAWAELLLSPLRTGNGDERFIGQLRDVTAETNEREQLRRAALYDALTGLPNRRLLQTRLKQAIARARDRAVSFALVFLDLDRFKQVNDTIGHEAADELLRKIAERLRRSVRAEDTVARLYGDEFALLITPVPQSARAEAISRRIGTWLQQPFEVDGRQLGVTCSVGVALFPDGTDGENLLGSADRDMYRRKRIRYRDTGARLR